jgi:hypothetical protein
MTGFRNPAGITRAATIALYMYMVLDPLAAVLRYVDPTPGGPADGATVIAFPIVLACFVLVGRWIYLTNANAHVFSDEMTIRPGWAVGWFFVPIANLFMPYQGVKETWRESHEAAGQFESEETLLLPWWWGLWIVTNILANLTFTLGAATMEIAPYLDLLSSALNVPLCLILIRLMRRLATVQRLASDGSVFA